MSKRVVSYVVVALVSMAFSAVFQPFAYVSSFAQAGCQTFPETGKSVCGRFLQYWQQNGGLAQQGLPLTGEFNEVSDLNGKSYTVQYFERAVFEKHPENTVPFDVLLSQLGTFQFKRKYPGGDPSGGQPPPAATQPPSGGQSINGQTIEFPGFLGKGKLRGTVTDVKETKTIPPAAGSQGGTARGKFVLVSMTVTNIGSESIQTHTSGLKLKDSTGRIFDITGDFNAWYAAVKAAGVASYQDKLQPGLPTPMLFVFDTAVDASGYYLVPGR